MKDDHSKSVQMVQSHSLPIKQERKKQFILSVSS